MLSPGEWHKFVPKDPKANLRFRKHLLDKAETNPAVQKAIVNACRHDLLFYVNTFVWQYNPQHVGDEVGPFITWPIQDQGFRKMLWCIEHRRDLRMEKSREMGATWQCLIVFDWLYQYQKRKKFLAISRSAEAVDNKDDSDSLFWKIEFMHEHLPSWMRPRERKVGMLFKNLDTGSMITGQASTGKAGVGGRCTAMFIDEFSQMMLKDGFSVLHRTADTTGCRIFNFTHTGMDTAAYEICKKDEYPDMEAFRLHWSDHPEKNQGMYQYNQETHQVDRFDTSYVYEHEFQFVMDGKLRSPWYDAECRRRKNKRAIAMDLDIDPKGSSSQFFEAAVIQQLKHAYSEKHAPLWEGDIDYNLDTGKPYAFVPRKGGPLRLWFRLRDGMPPPEGYGAGGDISAGTGATPSCLAFVSRETGIQVAEYANPHIKEKEFAVLAVALCLAFKNLNGEGAAFAWEMQGPGVTFGRKVIELGYRNVYFNHPEGRLAKIYTDSYGWYPSPENKLSVLTELRSALYKRDCVTYSGECLEETLDFVYNSAGYVEHSGAVSVNDPSGARVNHGDRVIALALGWWMIRGYKAPVKKNPEVVRVGTLAWRRQLHDNAQLAAENEWAS